MYVGEQLKLNHDVDFALRFDTEEAAEDFIEENEMEEWAGVEEQEYFFTGEASLSKKPSGYGHWIITAQQDGFTHSIKTSDSQLIDDAFNSEEGDTSYFDSVEEARETIIEKLND